MINTIFWFISQQNVRDSIKQANLESSEILSTGKRVRDGTITAFCTVLDEKKMNTRSAASSEDEETFNQQSTMRSIGLSVSNVDNLDGDFAIGLESDRNFLDISQDDDAPDPEIINACKSSPLEGIRNMEGNFYREFLYILSLV
jgi:hypothetical protein